MPRGIPHPTDLHVSASSGSAPVDVDFLPNAKMTHLRHILLRRLPRTTCLALAACAALIGAAAAQEVGQEVVQEAAREFAATLATAGTEDLANGTPGRIHVSGDKVRLETPELRDGYFVFDGRPNTAYFVRPALHTFMDARQSSVLAQIFVPLDPDNPCERWQAMAKLSGAAANGTAWQCERTGDETIDGRTTTTWRAVSPQQRTYAAWIDRELKIPLRVDTNFGTRFSLTDIVPGPQPDSLFRIPPNFQKFDPQGLIDRIKQSDVWVEPVEQPR